MTVNITFEALRTLDKIITNIIMRERFEEDPLQILRDELGGEMLTPKFWESWEKIFPDEYSILRDLSTKVEENINLTVNRHLLIPSITYFKDLFDFASEDILRQYESFIRTAEEYRNVYGKFLRHVIENPAFTSAFCLISRLRNRIDEKARVDLHSPSLLYKAWAFFTKNKIVLPYFGIPSSGISILLEKIDQLTEKLKDETLMIDLIDCIQRSERNKLSEILKNVLKSKDQLIDGKLIRYLVEILLIAREEIGRGKQISFSETKEYINTMFEQKAVFEYEVYSYLIQLGVPALPRLEISIPQGEQTEKKFTEVDVLALNLSENSDQDQIWGIEVTTRRNIEELRKKVENLLEVLKLAFNGPVGLVMLVQRDILGQARNEIADHYKREVEVKAYSLEDMYFHLLKLFKPELIDREI